ncbi:MAG: flavin reductase family protein [Peptostreptococcaceae bacterium]|nr:flavin reductase family protein [Peptostreptococcaceae bacterium]
MPKKKVSIKPGPMLYPLPAVMVTVGDMEENNIITIAWTGIINTSPPMTYISVKKSRHSHDILSRSREFVINLTTEKTVKATDYVGVKSGRDVDKFKEMSLTPIKADIVKAPMIEEAPINLECKVFEIKELPSHDMFLAEIVAVHIDEDLIDEKGKYCFEDAGLIAFNHGSYYKLSNRKIGGFGYSIMKNKTKKKLAKK